MNFFGFFKSFPELTSATNELDYAMKNVRRYDQQLTLASEDCYKEFIRKQPEPILDALFKIYDKHVQLRQLHQTQHQNIEKLKNDMEKLRATYDDINVKKKNHEKVKANFERSKAAADKAEQRLAAARSRGTGTPEMKKAEDAFEVASRQKAVDTVNYEDSEKKITAELKEYKIRIFQQLLQAIETYSSNEQTLAASLIPIGDEIQNLGSSIPQPEDSSVLKLKTRLQTLRALPLDEH